MSSDVMEVQRATIIEAGAEQEPETKSVPWVLELTQTATAGRDTGVVLYGGSGKDVRLRTATLDEVQAALAYQCTKAMVQLAAESIHATYNRKPSEIDPGLLRYNNGLAGRIIDRLFALTGLDREEAISRVCAVELP